MNKRSNKFPIRKSAKTPIIDSRLGRRKPRLVKVTDRVYCALGYSVSNAIYVITERSAVVIDTTESISAARASLADLRKIVDLPVSHIIYTHFHGDHIRGATVFHEPGVKVIAHRRMPEELARNMMLLPYRERVNAIQLGTPLPKVQGGSVLDDQENGYVQPDTLFEEQFRFEEGRTEFELFHTQGESADHLMVWLPGERILFPGDLFYHCFPMLSNPLKGDRPVAKWIESLERMRALGPYHLVPSHGAPIAGAAEIDSTLANYAKAIRHIHDETLRGINAHLTLSQILDRVRLPNELNRLSYLAQRYGTVRWAIKGIFRQYTGWYDFNPAHLNPSPRAVLAKALVDASGGAEPFLARARSGMEAGEHRIVLELTEIVLDVYPYNPRAHALRCAALELLGDISPNALERNLYRAAVNALRDF